VAPTHTLCSYSPATGKLIKKYEVPLAEQVTSCAFGGPGLDQLFVTTAAASGSLLLFQLLLPGTAVRLGRASESACQHVALACTGLQAGIEEARLVSGGDQANAGHLFQLDLSAEGIRGVPSHSYKLS